VTDDGSRSILRGNCPHCGEDRNAEVLAEDTHKEEDEQPFIWVRRTYSILRCLGCDSRYIRVVELRSEDAEPEDDPETGEAFWAEQKQVTYWPSVPTPRPRRRPYWLRSDPLQLKPSLGSEYPELASLLGEVYTALDHKLHILTTIGMRTVFDCASQKLGADPNQNFAEKLKELSTGNKISGEEKEMLSVLADAGSAAAHRGWKPTKGDINGLMRALENFLERAFVLKYNLRSLKKVIPARGGH